ncbi:MAG TPA: acylphosphatase [Gaiellaceae bacterium]|nr:acylphosphatase [Gaiellaceae bacterium]
MIRRRVVVHGHVQGVFFRDSTRRMAQRHRVAGWVANRRDGAVEAVFEGEADSVERLVAFSREGPRGASGRVGRGQRGRAGRSPRFRRALAGS